jgi:hypothetical protein
MCSPQAPQLQWSQQEPEEFLASADNSAKTEYKPVQVFVYQMTDQDGG